MSEGMDALLIFAARESAGLWRSGRGRTMLRGIVAELLSMEEVDQVLVVTDMPDAFQGLGAKVTAAIPPAQAGEGCLPPDTVWALDVLASTGQEPAGDVVALNPRYPFLSKGTISGAVKARKPGSMLLSAAVPSDHPCQFLTPVVMEQAGVVCLFESSPGAPGWLPGSLARDAVVTKPFAFDWPAGGAHTPEFFRRRAGDGLFEPARGHLEPDGEMLWARLGPGSAALIVSLNHLVSGWDVKAQDMPRLRGANLTRMPGDPSVLVMADDDGAGLSIGLSLPGAEAGEGLLKLASCSPGACTCEDVLRVAFSHSGVRAGLDLKMREAGALSFILLRFAIQEGHDFMMHYVPGSGLWNFDASRGVCVNAATGEPILGRQQFPLVVAPDGVIAIGPARALRDAGGFLRRGQASLYPLERHWEFGDDRLAIAQYLALKRI